MSDEPTLRHGMDSEDQWVEYLQHLLYEHGYYDGLEHGQFDDRTLAAVKQFQEDHGLVDEDGVADGVVGNATWSVLRGEAEAAETGTDGFGRSGAPVEKGEELRFTNDANYDAEEDWLQIEAYSAGTVNPSMGSIQPVIHLQKPDGTSSYPVARHGRSNEVHWFTVENITGGVPGRYSGLVQLPMETGGDTMNFEFDR